MTEIHVESKVVPTALGDRMQKGASHEQLLEIWSQLEEVLDLKTESPLQKALNRVHHSLKRGACDTYVKDIFENPGLLEELEALGIPKEFLLQCVMVGALVDQLNLMSYQNQNIEPQTLWLETNGWSWANEELKKCLQDRKGKDTRKAEETLMKGKVQKEAVIAQLQANLNNPDFEMTREQKDLLKEDFRSKLIQWKAFCDQYMSEKEINELRLSSEGGQPITPNIYARFVEICKNLPRMRAEGFPFEIMNPDSGWFHVVAKNNVNSINSFLQAAVSNMNNWFVL